MSYIIKLVFEVNNMAFYNLETKDRKYRFTEFEIWWDDYKHTESHLEHYFRIYFEEAYKVSKTYGERQDEFVSDLQKLKDDFYDGICGMIERKELNIYMPKEVEYIIKEKELIKIYDYFLPKQKAFAEKWGLGINVD